MQPQPAPFPVNQSRGIWDNLIARYGELALLRQQGIPDRWILVLFGQYSTMERVGGISNPADMKAVVSALSPDTGAELTPRPSEKDALVALLFNEDGSVAMDAGGEPVVSRYLKIIAPPAKIGGTSRPLYWRLSVRQ